MRPAGFWPYLGWCGGRGCCRCPRNDEREGAGGIQGMRGADWGVGGFTMAGHLAALHGRFAF